MRKGNDFQYIELEIKSLPESGSKYLNTLSSMKYPKNTYGIDFDSNLLEEYGHNQR